MYITYYRREIEENRKYYEMMYDASHHLIKIDSVMDWDFVSRKLEMFYPHRIVDSLHNFIIATDVTPANVPGHRKLMGQIQGLKQTLGKYANEIALDSGYYNASLARSLFQYGFFVYMSYRRFNCQKKLAFS